MLRIYAKKATDRKYKSISLSLFYPTIDRSSGDIPDYDNPSSPNGISISYMGPIYSMPKPEDTYKPLWLMNPADIGHRLSERYNAGHRQERRIERREQMRRKDNR